jgi:hypothetical protein
MNTKGKIGIFLVAVLVTLVGFNLIASQSAVDIFKLGQMNGYRVDVIASAKAPSDTPPVVHINGLP